MPYISKSSRGSTRYEYQTLVASGASGGVAGADAVQLGNPIKTEFSYLEKSFNGGKDYRRYRTCLRLGVNAATSMVASENKVYVDSQANMEVVGFAHATSTAANLYRRAARKGVWHGPNSMHSLGSVPAGSAQNDAAGKWYQKAAATMSAFKSQIFAGESREALQMMKTRSNQIIGMIPGWQRRVKKRDRPRRSPRDRLKAVSDAYLELTFGWEPLVSDIESAHKALNRARPLWDVVTGRGTHTASQKVFSEVGGSGAISFLDETYESTTFRCQYLGIVKLQPAYTGGGQLQEFGLHTREFLPTMWELLPWSFLVDYFTNVGEIVNAASYYGIQHGAIAVTNTRMREREYRSTLIGFGITPSNGVRIRSASPSSVRVVAKAIDRGIVADVPVPGITFELPGFRKCINMAALAISRRLRLR